MPRPTIAVGRGIKFYEAAKFGRQDATCLRVDNATGIIDLRTTRTSRRVNGVKYTDDVTNDADPYWVELPQGYTPGAGGN